MAQSRTPSQEVIGQLYLVAQSLAYLSNNVHESEPGLSLLLLMQGDLVQECAETLDRTEHDGEGQA